MGFLSSLFGTKSSTPSTTNVVQSKLPAELAPFVKEILGEAQQLYKGDLARGYQPYTGATIAPLTPDQEAALTGLAGLPGTTAPFLQRATELYETGGERFTPDTAQEFMSPYQRAVTDLEKREAQTAFERTAIPRFEASAVQAGGMSGLGTRAGVEAAEMQRGQSQLLADIEAKGLQKAYDDARKGFEQQKLRERGMAADLSGMGTQALTSGIAELGAQKSAGEERQGLSQSVLDEAYYKFLEEQQFPQSTLAQYQGSVYGNPLAKTFDTTETTTKPQPSTGQSLLSMGLSGLGMFGMGKGNIYGGGSPIRTAGGGSIGRLSDKKLGNYMREGSGAISAGDRDQLMRMYKSGLSGLPVVKRQAGSIESETIVEEEPNAYQEYVLPHIQKITRAAGDTLGMPSDVAMKVLKQLGITDSPPSASFLGSEKIKEEMKFIGGDEALPPTPRKSLREQVPDDDVETEAEKLQTVNDRIQAELRKGKQDKSGEVKGTVTETVKVSEKLEVPKKKDEISGVGFISDLIKSNTKFQKMTDEGITSINELQDQLKEAIGQDKETRKDSRTKRNELAFWRSLLIAGEAVGSADPSQGFLAAAAKGASAGGKSLVEARMKLAKEAEGDGQRAIDAAKTLLNVETADLKLQQAAMGTQAQALTAMANWAKANNIKTNPKTLNAAVQFIDKRSGISLGKYDPKAQARWDIISAHVMANLNTPSIWGNFPKSGEGFSDKAFSGNPNMTTENALKQLKGRKVEATQTRDPNT